MWLILNGLLLAFAACFVFKGASCVQIKMEDDSNFEKPSTGMFAYCHVTLISYIFLQCE